MSSSTAATIHKNLETMSNERKIQNYPREASFLKRTVQRDINFFYFAYVDRPRPEYELLLI
jgi:hypothetical protein